MSDIKTVITQARRITRAETENATLRAELDETKRWLADANAQVTFYAKENAALRLVPTGAAGEREKFVRAALVPIVNDAFKRAKSPTRDIPDATPFVDAIVRLFHEFTHPTAPVAERVTEEIVKACARLRAFSRGFRASVETFEAVGISGSDIIGRMDDIDAVVEAALAALQETRHE